MEVYKEGMNGGKKLILLAVVLVLLIGAFFGVRAFNASQDEKESGALMLSYRTEDVDTFGYIKDGMMASFSRNGNEWICDLDPGLKLDQESIDAMLESSSKIYADTIVADDLDDQEQYGLTDPIFTLSIHFKDGTEKTLNVGDQNSMSSLYYAYIADDGRIFAMKNSVYDDYQELANLIITDDIGLSE